MTASKRLLVDLKLAGFERRFRRSSRLTMILRPGITAMQIVVD